MRYARVERQAEGVPGRITHWIASIEYRFDKPPDDPRTRSLEPAGIRGTDLGIEPEVLVTLRTRRADKACSRNALMKGQSSFVSLGHLVYLLSGEQPARAQPLPGCACGRTRGSAWFPTGLMPFIGSEAMSATRSTSPSPPGERFLGLGCGGLEGGYVSRLTPITCFSSPEPTHVATNLTVLTNRRTYLFDYEADPAPPDPTGADVIYALRFEYPAAPVRPDQSIACGSKRILWRRGAPGPATTITGTAVTLAEARCGLGRWRADDLGLWRSHRVACGLCVERGRQRITGELRRAGRAYRGSAGCAPADRPTR